MESQTRDINDLSHYFLYMAMKIVLDDKLWQIYGFKKRPRRGNICAKLFPKRYRFEKLIEKDIFLMGLIDILNGIKQSNISPGDKLLIAVGVIDKILSVTSHLFDGDIFIENVITIYKTCPSFDNIKLRDTFILRAKKELNEKDFAKYLLGTLVILESPKGLLLSNCYLKEIIESTTIENQLKVGLSNNKVQQYIKLLSDNVFNT